MTTPEAPLHQRARGVARLSAKAREGRSFIDDLHLSGSLKLLFPRPRDAALDAVFLNTSGGITGGDAFTLAAEAGPGAHLRLTSQAAERIYRAMPGTPGRMCTTLRAGPGARIDWLPQETILFDGAALDRELSIELARDARLLASEVLVFGRAAMGEAVRDLHLRDRIDLRIDGRLVYADRLRLSGDAARTLDGAAVAGGAGAMATVLFAAPGAAAGLDALRALLPATGGASALSDDVIALRLLAADGFALRASLIPILTHLSAAPLPRPWTI